MREFNPPDNQQKQNRRTQGADDEDAADAGGLGNQSADGGTQNIHQIAAGVVNPRGQTAMDLVSSTSRTNPTALATMTMARINPDKT
jgi:hypothetical protein